jgi:ribose transport system ATP-binding protein
MNSKELILEMKDIVKVFPGVRALDGVKLDLYKGEVHALCGENGAGKSTLMKIISGAQSYTSGAIILNGEHVKFHSTKDAEKHGIAMIYQEFNMVPELSIAENIFLGRLPLTRFKKVDWVKLYKDANETLKKLGLDLDSRKKVKNISVAEAQMVEIAKALSIGANIIIMDEPTAAISDEEAETLFKKIEDLKSHGISIIYISHRMDEIFRISDRISVFRDGKYIDTKNVSDTNYMEVVVMMVGRSVTDLYPERSFKYSEDIMEVRNLTNRNVKSVDFTLGKGEILGIAGLLGSGNIELSKILAGAVKKQEGEVILNGKSIDFSSPRKALNAGIGFISDDRKMEGLVLVRDIKENVMLSSLKNISKVSFIDMKKEKILVNNQVKKLNIKISGIDQVVGNLSGGNQQKVVFGKMLETDPIVCILDEPTRGVDVGAKAEIYQIINELTKNGISVILVSSDLPELIGMSDRVLVMREGEVVKTLHKPEINQEIIMAYASGGIN